MATSKRKLKCETPKKESAYEYTKRWQKLHPEQTKAQHARKMARIKADPEKLARFKARRIARTKKWRKNNPDSARAMDRERQRRMKCKALNAYGGVCSCCDESDDRFLTIDHINGGGNKQRATFGTRPGGIAMYYWLQRNGYPEGFQVLCWNCNCGRSINGGVCPHKEKK